MAYGKVLIKKSEFLKSLHRNHQSYGVSSTINIPQILGRLCSFLEQADRTNSDQFYITERELYTPICEDLEALLPVPTIVDKESILKKLDNPNLKTDISIRDLIDSDKPRKGDFKSYCFIEIKSVFHDERISKGDIFEDIDKLIECENAYHAKCFFVLVGTMTELVKSPSALFLLRIGIPNDRRVSAFEVETNSGKRVWLMPSGSSGSGKFRVFTWSVSVRPVFPKGHTSRTYSIFQHE